MEEGGKVSRGGKSSDFLSEKGKACGRGSSSESPTERGEESGDKRGALGFAGGRGKQKPSCNF